MSRRFTASFLSSLFLAASPLWGGAPVDLGHGLVYFRIADLTKEDADVQTALTKSSVVIDFRNATCSPEAAAALNLKLEQAPPGPNGIRLLLINPESSAVLVEAVSHAHPRELTLGPRTPALAPDIAVSTSVDEDRRAYDALVAGAAIDKLISSNPEKRRFDEAVLARNHANGAASNDAEPEPEDAASTAEPTPAPSPEKKDPAPALPHDLVLGRAVQIHRALSAMKR